jgi:hypothetical protein
VQQFGGAVDAAGQHDGAKDFHLPQVQHGGTLQVLTAV